MDRREQEKFVKELTRSVLKDILALVRAGKIPREWDGHELRPLIAEHFGNAASMSAIFRKENKPRRKAYENACLVKNLT